MVLGNDGGRVTRGERGGSRRSEIVGRQDADGWTIKGGTVHESALSSLPLTQPSRVVALRRSHKQPSYPSHPSLRRRPLIQHVLQSLESPNVGR